MLQLTKVTTIPHSMNHLQWYIHKDLTPRLCLQEKFNADQTVVELADLLPATDYSVTLYALYDEEPSDPVTAVATTCKTFILPSLFIINI